MLSKQSFAGVVDALALDDELGELAAAHEVTKGRLFQALLEELRSAGVGHAQTDNSAKRGGAHDFRAEFGPARWHSLSLRADALRKLVRIKVADDNDLKTAREGFVLCKAFFDSLELHLVEGKEALKGRIVHPPAPGTLRQKAVRFGCPIGSLCLDHVCTCLEMTLKCRLEWTDRK